MIIIRRANQEDKHAIWSVHTRAIRETCKSHYSQEEIDAWASFLDPDKYKEVIDSREFLVAEKAGQIVGFGSLNKQSQEIEAVYVSPDAVRCGIGMEIMKALERIAREAGLESLHLSATLNAVPFYEAAGYRAKQRRKHPHPSGIELDCVYMEKEWSGRRNML